MSPTSSSVSFFASHDWAFLLSISTLISAITQLCSAVTHSLPVTTGTTHESKGHVKVVQTTTSHVVIVPVSAPVMICMFPVDNKGIVGALSVHPAVLAATKSNPSMYNFFIFLFKI